MARDQNQREREWAPIPAPERPRCARCGAIVRVTYTRIIKELGAAGAEVRYRRSFCDCQVCDLVNVYVEEA